MKQAVIDRFEGKIAVLLIDGQPFDLPVANLPPGTREGDYLQVEMHGGKIIAAKRDETTTAAAKKRIADKLDRLRRGEHLDSDDQPN